MTRATREGAGLLLLLAAVVTCHAATCDLDQRPNIVFVLMDDCGWGDVDWNDPYMRTPNIRAIKDDGRSMTNAYSLQLCSPSRSALLTGKMIRRKRKAPDSDIISEELKLTTRGEQFLAFQTDDIVILTTPSNLDVLARNAHWFCDGTFDSAPNLQSLGLQDWYLEPENSLLIKTIQALAFVPPDDVIEAFQQLMDSLDADTDETLSDFLAYFESTWLGIVQRGRRRRPKFDVAMWNVYSRVEDNLPRTNNSVEGWQRAFDQRMSVTHPTLGRLVSKLRKEQASTELMIEQHAMGVRMRKNKQYEVVNTRLQALVARYPHTYGLQVNRIFDNNLNWLPENLKLVSQELKDLNYTTHMIGKWHLGFCDWDLTPLGRGFDTFYGKVKGNSNYFTHNAQFKEIESYYDFFDQTRNVPEAYRARCGDRRKPPGDTTVLHLPGLPDRSCSIPGDKRHNRPTPSSVPEYYVDKYCSHIQHRPRQIYCAMMAAADEGIGNITTALKDTVRFNWPLRGGKVTLFEGGTKVFSVIKAPGIVNNTGNDWDGLFHELDWYPTLVEAACGTPPSSLDGVSQYQQIVTNTSLSLCGSPSSVDGVSQYQQIMTNTSLSVCGSPSSVDGVSQNQQVVTNSPSSVDGVSQYQQIMTGHPGPRQTMLYNIEKTGNYGYVADPYERNNIYAGNETLQDVIDLKALITSEENRLVSAQDGGQSPVAIGIRNQLGHWNPGWCSVDPLPGVCNPDPCQNGGTCFQEDYTYRCACPLRASGTHCETLIACNVPGLTQVHITNIKSVQSTTDGDIVTPSDPSAEFSVQYDVTTQERCTMESVTFKLLGGDAKNLQMALFDGSNWNDDGYVFLPNVKRDIEMTLPYLLAQVGTKVRFIVTPETGTTDITLLVKNISLCVGLVCQPAIFSKVWQQNVASINESNGEITVTPTNPANIFKVVYQVNPKETATFTRVTYRVLGTAPKKIRATVLNHPDSTNNGTVFDTTFTVGQDEVGEFSPPAIGNRVRFAIFPTTGTTAIQFVIVSIEACLGS
ncbi:hypothetical protein BaRGS_00016808, partial [Batillaria attramentaria]